MRKPDFAYAKTKAQINCAVTAQLISAFVFAIWIVKFLFSLNHKFQASVATQAGLCQTWSETLNYRIPGFLVTYLNNSLNVFTHKSQLATVGFEPG